MTKGLLGLGAALVWGLCCATASAQTIGAPSVRVLTVERDHQQEGLSVSQINATDCLTDDRLTFSIELQRYEGYELEVWAGEACELITSRAPATATCWQVFSGQPNSAMASVVVPVKDLLRGRTRADAVIDGDSATADAACESASSSVAPQSLEAFVLLVDASEVAAGESSWTALYKLSGSPPPDSVSAATGDGQLLVEYAYDAVPPDPYFHGVQLFCDPPPNDPSAGISTSVTTSDAGVLDPVCPDSAALIAGAPAASLQDLRCGSANADARSAIANGLVNGVSYNVAVAAVDTFGNVGPLSPIACQIPHAKLATGSAPDANTAEPTGDTSARACSFAGTGTTRRWPALMLMAVLGAALARRRDRN